MPIDKVYASWTEVWDVGRYVEHYLRTHGCEPSPQARNQVLSRIAEYPGGPPFTKSGLDYYLDANGGLPK